MNQSTLARRQRENVVLVVLTVILGGGIFLALLLLTGWLFVAVLSTVVVLGLAAGLHYLIWGRNMPSQIARERREEGRILPGDNVRHPVVSGTRPDVRESTRHNGDLP